MNINSVISSVSGQTHRTTTKLSALLEQISVLSGRPRHEGQSEALREALEQVKVLQAVLASEVETLKGLIQ